MIGDENLAIRIWRIRQAVCSPNRACIQHRDPSCALHEHYALLQLQWRPRGANLLGILLMEVRDTVRTDAVVRANDELDAQGAEDD